MHSHTHIYLHVEVEEGKQCTIFEHECADVVVALHAWVRLYSTWLQYPTGLEMRSNTLTQLSHQTNWVWVYVYVCVCRRSSVYVCLNACVTLSCTCLEYTQYCIFLLLCPLTLKPSQMWMWEIKLSACMYVRLSVCVCCIRSCICNDCTSHTDNHVVLCLSYLLLPYVFSNS